MIVWFAFAWGAVPDGLRPVAAPADIEARFRGAGAEPPVCTPVLPEHVALCFRVWEAGRRRWVKAGDLAAWGVGVEELRRAVIRRGQERLRGALERRHIDGMPADARSVYAVLRDGDGWAVVALLVPDLLREVVGEGRFRVAIPRAGVLFAWGDPVGAIPPLAGAERDRILMIAVRESYEAADDAVSPMVYTWSGAALEPFGQAKKKEESP